MNAPSVWLQVGVLYTFDWKMRNAQTPMAFHSTDSLIVILMILLEEILHHLGCKKTPSIMGYLPYQLVQDFFHQQYLQKPGKNPNNDQMC